MPYARLLTRLPRVPRSVRALSALVLALMVATVPAAAEDGSATDNAMPKCWLDAPDKPDATPCLFTRTLLTSWKAQGVSKTDTCNAVGVGVNWWVQAICLLADHCEGYSNAALLANEIWGYTWSDDGQGCYYDECSTADSEGLSSETVVYRASPYLPCNATIEGDLKQQFRWRVEGRGHAEVEVAGQMICQGTDLVFPGAVVSGGKAAYVGDRAGDAPSGGTIQIGKPPLVITIPISTFDAPYLPTDEGVEFYAGPITTAGPVPLTNLGEVVVFRGYVKVRSTSDEPGLWGSADIQGWIRDSDPGFDVTLTCMGGAACDGKARSKRKK
ncbi:MAG: hypothetical protein O2894_10175 [Planctomycetota bacterium]|nr:hypothetical protein [Planctomycetota bacterium]